MSADDRSDPKTVSAAPDHPSDHPDDPGFRPHTDDVHIDVSSPDSGSKMLPPLSYPPLFRPPEPLSPGSASVAEMYAALRHDVNPSFVVEHPEARTRRVVRDLFGSGSHFRRKSGPLTSPSRPLSPMPQLTRADFAPYLAQLRSGQARIAHSDEAAAAVASAAEAASGASSHEAAAISPSRHSGHTGSGAGATAAVNAFISVPKIYFKEPFHLKQDGVLAELIKAGPLPHVQDRLTAHLDTVECQLLTIIRERSTDFFAALGTLQDLRDSVADSHVLSVNLMRRVERLKEEGAVRPLAVIAATRRRQRQHQVAALLHALADARKAAAAVAVLVANSDFAGALALIGATRAALLQRTSAAAVGAAAAVLAQLDRFERLIGDTLVAAFTSAATTFCLVGGGGGGGAAASALHHDDEGGAAADDDGYYSAADAAASRGGGGGGSAAAAAASGASALSALRGLADALVRTRRLGDALAALQAALLREIRLAVRSEVGEGLRVVAHAQQAAAAAVVGAASGAPSSSSRRPSADAAAASAEPPPAPPQLGDAGEFVVDTETLAALPAVEFLALLRAVSGSLLEILQRALALHDMLERALDAAVVASAAASSATAAAAASFASSAAAPPLAAGGVAGSSSSSSSSASSSVAASPTPAAAAAWRAESSRLRAVSSGMLAAAVDAAQRHSALLLSRRREHAGSAGMRVGDVKALWDACVAFALASNALLAHTGSGAGVHHHHHAAASQQQQHLLHLQAASPFALPPAAAAAMVAASVAAASASAAAAPSPAQALHASPAVAECLLHARALLQFFHRRNSGALLAMLDAELWRAADVPPQVQAVADAMVASIAAAAPSSSASSLLLQSAVTDAAAASSATAQLLPSSSDAGDELATPAPTAATTAAAVTPHQPVLLVKGARFHVVGTGVMLVKMLGEYCGLAEAVPELAPDAVAAIVELLRAFNGRALQLVLGAAAVASAGLKRITAKHLALAAQTLDAVLALLPSIRGALVMRLAPAQHVLLAELARVTADFMQHEQRLLAKFVSMVRDSLARAMEGMKPLPWGDVSAPMPIPSAPMRELVRDVATLHRILAPVLRGDQMADVLWRVCSALAAQAPVAYAALLAHAANPPPAPVRMAVPPAAGGANGEEEEDDSGVTTVPLASFSRLFSRDVALERMAADLAVLADVLDGLQAPAAAGGSSGGCSGCGGADEAAALPSAGLRAWIAHQFPSAARKAQAAALAAKAPAPSVPEAAAAEIETVPAVAAAASGASSATAEVPESGAAAADLPPADARSTIESVAASTATGSEPPLEEEALLSEEAAAAHSSSGGGAAASGVGASQPEVEPANAEGDAPPPDDAEADDGSSLHAVGLSHSESAASGEFPADADSDISRRGGITDEAPP